LALRELVGKIRQQKLPWSQDDFMKIWKEIYQYRQMIFSLVKKDLRGRYKGSVLGFLWTFINPLMQLVVYTFVFTYIMKAGIERYYLYLFVALVPWIFFSSAITGGSSSIVAQKDLVKKIYFPREVIPISYVTSCFVNMLLCFCIIFLVMLVAGIPFRPLALLCLPVVMIVEYLLALGMAMLSSAITVYFRDLEHILGIVTMIWMYMTPIFYSIDMIPEKLRFIYHLNPMSSVISCYRDVLYSAKVPDLSSLLEAAVLGVFFLVVGMLVFGKLKKGFAEEL
jgi:ABC-2 type transport system permease protein